MRGPRALSAGLRRRLRRFVVPSLAVVSTGLLLAGALDWAPGLLRPAAAASGSIRQELNIVDKTYSGTNAVISSNERIQVDTTKFGGSVSYYLEVVGTATASSTGSIRLRRSGTSTDDATLSTSNLGTSTTRLRSTSFSPPVGATEYFLYVDAAGASKTVSIQAARVIVVQTGTSIATSQTQIEIGSNETGKTNTTAAALTNPKYWKYNSSSWSNTKFYAETTYMKTDTTVTTPSVYGVGAVSGSANALNVAIPSGTTTNDILVMFCETNNQAITVTGWTEAGNSPQSDATDSTRLTVFWKRAGSSEFNPTTSDSGDHQTCGIVGVRGAATTGDPFDVTAGGSDASSSTSASIPGATTTVANALVLAATSTGRDSTGTTEFSGWTNASLTSVTERLDGINNSGAGGGVGVASGLKATAGTYNATTATLANASRKGMWSGALKPGVDTTPTITVKLQEDDGSFGSWTDVTNGGIVSSATSATVTRVRTATAFVPTSGRNYRIVASTSNAASNYDIYNAKIIAESGTAYTSTTTQPSAAVPTYWTTASMSSDGQTMLAGADNSRLSLSTNGGSTTTEVQPAGDVNANWRASAVSADGQTMLAGAYSGRLYRSTNGGTTWSETQPAGDVATNWQTISIGNSGQTILAAVNNDRVYRSTNGGTSWSEVQPAGNVGVAWSTSAMSSDGQTMLVGANLGRLYRSTNGGTSWSQVQPAGNFDKAWSSVAISADGTTALASVYGGRVYRSTNGGSTWSETQPAGAVDQSWIFSMLSGDAQHAFVSDQVGSVYESTNGGSTWSVITRPTLFGNLAAGAISNDGQKVLTGYQIGRLYRSTDSAASWTEVTAAGNTSTRWQSSAISSNGQTMFAGVSSGRLFRSTNAGATWSEVQPAGNTDQYWGSLAISSDGQTVLAGCDGGRLYRSTDGGTSWTEMLPGGNVDLLWESVAMSGDGQTMLVGSFGGRLYVSTNGGSPWTEVQPAGAIDQNWHGLSVSSDGQTMLAGANSKRLYRSTNGGTTWAEVQPAGNVDAYWFTTAISSNGQTMLAGVNGTRLYRSTNGGTSWAEVQPAGNTLVSWTNVSMRADGQLMLAGAYAGRLYRSIDSGTTWREVQPLGNVTGYWWTGATSATDGSKMLAGNDLGRLFVISNSTGVTAEPQYLVLNGPDSNATGLQGGRAYYDSTEWSGAYTDFRFSIDSDNAANGAKLQDVDNSNADVTSSAISGANQQVSNSLTMPATGHNIDVNVTNTTGTIAASRIIARVSSNPFLPEVYSISPTTGITAGGTTVTVTGLGFSGATGVTFGAVAGTSVTVVSDSTLTVVSPAQAAGTVHVTVTGPAGTSATNSADQFTYASNTAPNAATSLTQVKYTGGATISSGGWTAESSVVLGGTVSDVDNPDSVQLCVEVKDWGTSFDGVGESCASLGAYSGTPLVQSVTVTGLTNGLKHWRARTKDTAGAASSWSFYGGSDAAAHFGVDTETPSTASAVVYDGSSTGVDATFNDGSLTQLSANWAGFSDGFSGLNKYQYAIGTSAGGTQTRTWTDNGSATSVAATGLSLVTSQLYFISVRYVDVAGNTSATVSSNGQLVAPTLSFTLSTSSVSLGNLNALDSFTSTASFTATVSTNAAGGYTIKAFETQPMTSGSATIADYASSIASPTTWSGFGFGYNVSGSAAIAGFSGSKYARFGTVVSPDSPVVRSAAGAGVPITNETHTFSLKVATSSSQQSGLYGTSLVLSSVAIF